MVDQSASSPPAFDPADLPERPVSPHLQIWRWAVTMASSISQRVTGSALYGGYFLLVAWIASAALGESAFSLVSGLLASPLGLIILAGFTWAQMYHLSKGILHLVWDSGHLLAKERAKLASWIVFAASILLTILIWAVALGLKG